MPGLTGDDGVKGSPGRVPVFKPRDLNLEPASARELGHPRVDIHAQQPATSYLEQPSGNAGTDSDVEKVVPWAGGDYRIHHGAGIAGPSPVVPSRVRAKRLRNQSSVMRLV